jgi:hypothetical protein
MANEIISYHEMCGREQTALQRGMNFSLRGNHSVILMSVRPNSPYDDRLEDGGTTLIYEGHDEPRTPECPNPKAVDQPQFGPNYRLTQNGLFHRSAQSHMVNGLPPERVRVYEKLRRGIWSYNGVFHLVDSWKQNSGGRQVFRFKLIAVEGDEDFSRPPRVAAERRRLIPTPVKLRVWKRDAGKCVLCGSSSELHFDHVVPVAKGGTSMVSENIQLLCARHNLAKSDNII